MIFTIVICIDFNILKEGIYYLLILPNFREGILPLMEFT